MKSVWSASIALMGGITVASSEPQLEPIVNDRPLQVAGNTSSNSSSNSASDGGSSIRTHDWLVETDRNGRRQTIRGSTRIDGYAPERRRRPSAVYEHFRDD